MLKVDSTNQNQKYLMKDMGIFLIYTIQERITLIGVGNSEMIGPAFSDLKRTLNDRITSGAKILRTVLEYHLYHQGKSSRHLVLSAGPAWS